MAEVEKTHKAIWKVYERLSKDRQELAKLEAERARALARKELGEEEEPVDSGLTRKLEALRLKISEAEATVSELCIRHRQALEQKRAAAAEDRAAKLAELQTKIEAARVASHKAQRQAAIAAGDVERLKSSAWTAAATIPVQRSLEGTAEEILELAKSNPDIAIDPLSLVAGLRRLEEREDDNVIRREGKLYIRCPDRLRVEVDPSGQVVKVDILSTQALEAREEEGGLVVVGAAR